MIALSHCRRPRDFRDLSATLFQEVARRNSLSGSGLNRVARLSRLFLYLRVCVCAHVSASMRVHMRRIAGKSRECRANVSNRSDHKHFRRATSIPQVAFRSRMSRTEAKP